MSRDHRPQSWEHLLERDPRSATGLRVGMVAALLVHAAIFTVTWPTVAQAPPERPDDEYIPYPITTIVPPPARPPEPIPIEIPVPPPDGPPVVDGPPEEVVVEPSIMVEPPPTGPLVVRVPPDPPLPPPEPPPTVVTVNIDIDPPEIEHRVEPRYTEPARRAGIEGFVILELLIDTAGAVESVKVHRGLPLGLTQSAVAAVERWRFRPSTFNGHPVRVRYILTVRFTLD